jgi:hypothetical protein
MIERLAKAHPERAAPLLADRGETAEDPSLAKPPLHVQAGLRELDELDIQSQKSSPLFALFDNEVVCSKPSYKYPTLNLDSSSEAVETTSRP